MLASDVALYSDGGESLTPTHGAGAVARALLASIQRISSDTQWRWQPYGDQRAQRDAVLRLRQAIRRAGI